MDYTAIAGSRSGKVHIPSSKSQMHRLLICAALGSSETDISFNGMSKDIRATADCLNALGAEIREVSEGVLHVRPVSQVPEGLCRLPCGESGSTLRFMLPVAGVLGAQAVFLMEGRLPQRPLAPFDEQLTSHGMQLRKENNLLYVSGKLSSGSYTLPGDVSSQYISGLLMALPLAEGSSTLEITGKTESAAYIGMTLDVLRASGVSPTHENNRYQIPGSKTYTLPASCSAEGDWSNAAFFLSIGALSPKGVTVSGLLESSSQGDSGVLDILRRFGADVKTDADGITVSGGTLKGIVIDAAPIPDLIPVLSVVASAAQGDTHVINAARLRLKESDRLATTAGLLRALGGSVEELEEGLIIHGGAPLSGGTADSCNDHRIAMSAAVASCISTNPVEIQGIECTAKSYPRFQEDFEKLIRL